MCSCTVPGCITKIGEEACSCCGALEQVIIPSTVTSVGEDAFLFSKNGLVITTESGSAADRYCRDAWGVKCEYISAEAMAAVYGDIE